MSQQEQDFAERINTNLCISKNQEVFIDPVTISIILGIISLIINALRLYCQIKHNREDAEKIQGESQNPGPIARRLVARHVRKQLGREEYQQCGQYYIDAIFRTCAESSTEEIMELL